jgi:hypothetical protein
MKTETKCPAWPVCGGGIVHQYWAQQTNRSDAEKKYVATYCLNKIKWARCPYFETRKHLFPNFKTGGDGKLRIIEILENFWYRFNWFIKKDSRNYLMWGGVIIIGLIIIGCLDLKELFEKIKKKGGVK